MAKSEKRSARDTHTENVFFEKNEHLPMLYGDSDAHLERIEQQLHVGLVSRGNMISITGEKRDIEATEKILQSLYEKIDAGGDVSMAEVDAAIRMMPPVIDEKVKTKQMQKRAVDSDVYIRTMKKTIAPYSHVQANYMRALYDNDLVFALGPAGTGKTYIAVATAVYHFINKKVERIILSRPAVEAGGKNRLSAR
jgi:phosphate starvation-inducible PhoH-like protein